MNVASLVDMISQLEASVTLLSPRAILVCGSTGNPVLPALYNLGNPLDLWATNIACLLEL